MKDSTSIIKKEFCKAYTLDEQYKVHSIKSFIDIIDELQVCIYADLFGNENTLLSIRNYQYGTIFINKATCIRFPITMKSKNGIYKESKIVFIKMEIYIGKKI